MTLFTQDRGLLFCDRALSLSCCGTSSEPTECGDDCTVDCPDVVTMTITGHLSFAFVRRLQVGGVPAAEPVSMEVTNATMILPRAPFSELIPGRCGWGFYSGDNPRLACTEFPQPTASGSSPAAVAIWGIAQVELECPPPFGTAPEPRWRMRAGWFANVSHPRTCATITAGTGGQFLVHQRTADDAPASTVCGMGSTDDAYEFQTGADVLSYPQAPFPAGLFESFTLHDSTISAVTVS